jgi:hypothetical protein
LSQTNPITVYVSTRASTTIEFPAPVQSVASWAFTMKPNDDTQCDFCYLTGSNWITIQAMKENAEQNLTIVIYNRVYQINVKASVSNDFAVIFSFGEPRYLKPARDVVWKPLRTAQ